VPRFQPRPSDPQTDPITPRPWRPVVKKDVENQIGCFHTSRLRDLFRLYLDIFSAVSKIKSVKTSNDQQ